MSWVGQALRDLGIQMIPAYSPQARGRREPQLRHMARTPAPGAQATRHGQRGEANRFLREYMAEFNRRFQVPAAQAGSAFVACRRRDLDLIFSLSSSVR